MSRNKYIFFLVIILLFVVLIAVQHYAPRPIDWRVTCDKTSKSPYGCYVLNDMLKTLFPQQKITYNEAGFFVSLDSNVAGLQNLIVITPDFKPDRYDTKALLNFVIKGNDMFVSSTNFSNSFLDTLRVKVNTQIIDTSVFKPGNEVLYLENITLKNDSVFHFNRKMPLVTVSAYDTLCTTLLGTDRNHHANFICIERGLGKIYLHTQPLVFTNYHLLYGNIEYASAALSYLPVQKTVWDSYYKPGNIVNTSPVRYILSQPPLQTAYYILLLTLVLYMVIESKRRQRIIPVVKPPENRSLQFVRTIGNLYYKQHNNADIAKKKIIFFREFLREHYYIATISAEKESINHLASKSGLPVKQIKQLLEATQYFETAKSITDDGLIELSQRIELFYEQCL